MTSTPSSHAVIGAGIAGLACARALADAGHDVIVFDKARGPGGRMSSRRLEDASIELGAQSFRAAHPAFRQRVEAWVRAGVAAPWPEALWKLEGGQAMCRADGQPRYTGSPRMSAVTRHLARGLDLRAGTRIVSLTRESDGWRLVDERGANYGPFATVSLALPAPQAEGLIAPHAPALAAACRQVTQRACWAVWARLEAPLALPGAEAGWPLLQFDDGPLKHVVRHRTKPGREGAPELITLLADLDWSERRLEDSPEAVAEALLDVLRRALETLRPAATLPAVQARGAHRWRYAEPAAPAPGADFRLTGAGLALCGDGWRGGRIEDAWLSGHHLGEALCHRHSLPDRGDFPT
ncbi:NAD(P)/FAD-dependent oxidoreductase [Halomonas getboli]|uniref:NAD(P)/FAD-dependent oxidoreductase n=1 Tax=Halomonas getboli TaxID=2935862 RepID=UPI0020003D49|nr:FAD-dependent oxidoreductase [Halomonas getboli]MCK2185445.1 FAD-dependent oxidoreductase [Halomonas getboli]